MEIFLTKVVTVIISGIVVISSYLTPVYHKIVDKIGSYNNTNFGADNYNFVGGQRFKLAGSGITSSASSVVLQSFQTPVNNQNITMSDFGTIGYGTIEPATSRREFISFGGVTQNSDGTATLTGVIRGLAPISPYTSSSTLQVAHSGGALFVISNPPQLYNKAVFKDNDETIYGIYTFSSTSIPRLDVYVAPTLGAEFTPKTYVDGVATAGCADATFLVRGCVEVATSVEVASSTFTGGTGAQLVIPARFATNTPAIGAVATSTIPVTQPNTGKLHQGFLDLTEGWNFNTGSSTFNGNLMINGNATTTNATTTALNISSANLRINGVAQYWPAYQAASSTSAVNDGEGRIIWSTGGMQLLKSITTSAASGSIALANLPPRNHLIIKAYVPAISSAERVNLRFNADAGTNYGWAVCDRSYSWNDVNNCSDSNSAGATFINLIQTSTTSPMYYTAEVLNLTAQRKIVDFHGGVTAGTVQPPRKEEGTGVWNNTSAQIHEVALGCAGGTTCTNPVTLEVYGHD